MKIDKDIAKIKLTFWQWKTWLELWSGFYKLVKLYKTRHAGLLFIFFLQISCSLRLTKIMKIGWHTCSEISCNVK